MSIYGLTKQVQEQAVLLFARTRKISGFGLRYQNVYGPGQSLKTVLTHRYSCRILKSRCGTGTAGRDL